MLENEKEMQRIYSSVQRRWRLVLYTWLLKALEAGGTADVDVSPRHLLFGSTVDDSQVVFQAVWWSGVGGVGNVLVFLHDRKLVHLAAQPAPQHWTGKILVRFLVAVHISNWEVLFEGGRRRGFGGDQRWVCLVAPIRKARFADHWHVIVVQKVSRRVEQGFPQWKARVWLERLRFRFGFLLWCWTVLHFDDAIVFLKQKISQINNYSRYI